ncbi:hypothetical protein ACO1O0_009221 [Amphichorda felina]
MEGMTLTFSAATKTPKKTCVPCRQRKVRCTSKQPGVPPCDNCRRLKFDCFFRNRRAASGTDRVEPLAKLEPRRVSKACVRCREHKIRCTGNVPCATCLKKSALCEYTGAPVESSSSRREASQSDDASVGGNGGTAEKNTGSSKGRVYDETLTCSSTMDTSASAFPVDASGGGGIGNAQPNNPSTSIPALMEAFFQHVYPLPSYAFLHPPTISKKFSDGTIEKCLVNAIAAVSSVRAPGIRPCPNLESAWIQEAETLIWQHLESPSIARLQAMLLVILYRAETGQLRRAFMLASLAGRAATAMRLNHERPGSSPISLEVRRRLMWSLKLVERYFSVGLPEFELCPVENIYIQLPCVEYQFSGDSDTWEAADDRGSYHISVKLEMFRRDVMKLNRSLALCDQPFPQLPKLMDDFQQHLDRIGAQLPDGPEPSPSQIDVWLHSRWLPRYLIMRLSFHQTHIDLYRLLLRNFRDAAPRVVVDSLDVEFLNTAEALCIRHAKMTVQTIAALSSSSLRRGGGGGGDNDNDDNDGTPPRLLEFDTAICAYTASRMLLFTARFGFTPERPSEEFALSRAELCLAAVRRFFPRSMLVRPIIGELQRLIDVFASNGTPAPSRFSSPKPEASGQDHRDPTTQLSSAARIRQRLAIHSLLRQANFVDEDDEVEEAGAAAAAAVVGEPMTGMSVLQTTETDSESFEQGGPSQYPDQTMEFPSAGPAGVAGNMAMTENSPETSGDNESWPPHWSFGGGDLLQEGQTEAPTGVALTQRSFIFPWLQREESDLVPQNIPW